MKFKYILSAIALTAIFAACDSIDDKYPIEDIADQKPTLTIKKAEFINYRENDYSNLVKAVKFTTEGTGFAILGNADNYYYYNNKYQYQIICNTDKNIEPCDDPNGRVVELVIPGESYESTRFNQPNNQLVGIDYIVNRSYYDYDNINFTTGVYYFQMSAYKLDYFYSSGERYKYDSAYKSNVVKVVIP